MSRDPWRMAKSEPLKPILLRCHACGFVGEMEAAVQHQAETNHELFYKGHRQDLSKHVAQFKTRCLVQR